MKKIFYLYFFLAIITKVRSQTLDRCGSMDYEAFLLQNDTLMESSKDYLNFKSWLKQYESENEGGINQEREADAIINIPVVVHLIGSNVIGMVGFPKVQEQIDILNQDFGKYPASNGYGNGVDTKVRFCLASTDIQGNPTNGIVYVAGTYPSIWNNTAPSTNSNSDHALKSLSHWDAKKYLNLYVVEEITNGPRKILGYSSFPWVMANLQMLDGVVIAENHFGMTSDPNFGLGRIATHEVGHWLGLYHTFERNSSGTQEAACLNSQPTWEGDRVADTPPVATPNSGCNIFSNSCSTDSPNLNDLVENYMDYTNNACMNMFTQGQADRIHTPMRDPKNFMSCLEQCNNRILDGDETGIDCGGQYCPPCSSTGDEVKCFRFRDSHTSRDADDPWNIQDNSCKGVVFRVNNKSTQNSVIKVCKNNILLTPVAPGGWLFKGNETSYLCSNTGNMGQAAKKSYTGMLGNKCHCIWLSLRINITECNASLSAIGQTYSEEKFFYDNDQSTINELGGYNPLDLNSYLPAGFQFQDGKYYMLEIQSSNPAWGSNTWVWHSRAYIMTYGPNLNLQNLTLTFSQVADDIILDNCNVNLSPSINVVAKNSINVINECILNSGHYFIDSNLDCVSGSQYRQENISETQNSNLENHTSQLQNSSVFNSPKKQPMLPNMNDVKNTSGSRLYNQENKIKIFPNPGTDLINIVTSDKTYDDIANFEIIDNLGRNYVISKSKEIDISEFAKGFYQLKLVFNNGSVIVKSFIKN